MTTLIFEFTFVFVYFLLFIDGIVVAPVNKVDGHRFFAEIRLQFKYVSRNIFYILSNIMPYAI